MKVKFKFGIGSYAGTIDLATFYETKNGNGSFMRKWVKPKLTDQNAELGSIGKNLAQIYREVSAAYKEQLGTYVNLYNTAVSDSEDIFQVRVNKYAMFIKMFYAFAAANGGSVDLKSLSFGDLATLFPEIINIAAACNEGFLLSVPGCELLTENM